MSRGQFDAVVVGGGMVGAAAVLALRQVGLRCALVEQNPVPQWQSEEMDLRVSAISPASTAFLQGLDVWSSISEKRVSAYHRMNVWERPDAERLIFSADDVGADQLGHIVENNLIVKSLRERIRDEDVYFSGLKSLESADAGLWLTLEEGTDIKTRLLVGADGVQSQVRNMAGLSLAGSSYEQRALVCHVKTQESHQATAWQRFLPGGPLALLPLSDGRCSIVWSLPESEAVRLQALEDAGFSQELTSAFGDDLGELCVDSARASFPLAHRHANRYVAGRVVLIGDAAHVVHPLAGQGGNLGMLDAATLAEVVGQAVAKAIDPAHPAILNRYERRRRGDNLAMLGVTDGLQRMFAANAPAFEAARRVGLDAVNRLAPLKSALIQHAMYGPSDSPLIMRPPGMGADLAG